jgi:hypothetical protein
VVADRREIIWVAQARSRNTWWCGGAPALERCQATTRTPAKIVDMVMMGILP